MGQSFKDEFDYDLLGEIVMNCYRFRKNEFDQKLNLFCPVNNQEVEAGEMFVKKRGKQKSYLLKNDFLPADANIKAIAVSTDEIQIESSPLDEEYLQNDLVNSFDTGIKYNSRSAYNVVIQQEKTHIISFLKRNDRWVWFIYIRNMKKQQDLICRIVDRIYSDQYFVNTVGLEEIVPQKIMPALGILQQVEQTLRLEQTPRLIMGMQTKPSISQMPKIHTLQSMIMKMEPKDLEEFLLKDLSLEKAKKYMRVFIFVITRKIKDVMPNLTWKEARNLARQMIDGGSQQGNSKK